MKRTVIGLCAVAVLIAAGFLSEAFTLNESTRVYQHLIAQQPAENDRSAEEYIATGVLSTHLPILTIDTDGQEIPGLPDGRVNGQSTYSMAEDGGKTIRASLTAIEGEGYHSLSDEPTLTSEINIRVREGHGRIKDTGRL